MYHGNRLPPSSGQKLEAAGYFNTSVNIILYSITLQKAVAFIVTAMRKSHKITGDHNVLSELAWT
jgi:hypothetical protein